MSKNVLIKNIKLIKKDKTKINKFDFIKSKVQQYINDQNDNDNID